MLYLYTTSKLYILFSGNVDNDVVLVSTVVEDGGVLKLHTEYAQILNLWDATKNLRPM